MAKSGLRNKIAWQTFHTLDRLEDSKQSAQSKLYQNSLNKFNKLIDQSIKIAEKNPEEGVFMSAQYGAFVLLANPNQKQDRGRSVFLKQCSDLKYYLELVRNPQQYLKVMQEPFGPHLDVRDYDKHDNFSTTIKSQRRHLSDEGKSSFNTQDEKDFFRKRSELLAVVEKAYNHLRDKALGISDGPPPMTPESYARSIRKFAADTQGKTPPLYFHGPYENLAPKFRADGQGGWKEFPPGAEAPGLDLGWAWGMENIPDSRIERHYKRLCKELEPKSLDEPQKENKNDQGRGR